MVKIPDVPQEYKKLNDKAVLALEDNANIVMWITEMLGYETFEIETDKYKIIIKPKNLTD